MGRGRHVQSAALAVVALMAACIPAEPDLEGRPCPCIDGRYICIDDVCVLPVDVDSGPDGGTQADARRADVFNPDAADVPDTAPPDARSDAAFDALGDATVDAADAGHDAAVVDPSLVAHYTCEALEGGTLPDVSGNGHDGACPSGRCPTLSAGRNGSACTFDGSGHVVVPSSPRFDPTGGFTAAVWVRPSDMLNEFSSILGVAFGDDFFNSWQVFLFRTGSGYGVSFVSTDGASAAPLTRLAFPLGEWRHFVWTYDGMTKRGYVDGELAVEAEIAIAFDGVHNLTLGADELMGDIVLRYHGDLDDVLLYDRALGAGEVRALFGGTLPVPR